MATKPPSVRGIAFLALILCVSCGTAPGRNVVAAPLVVGPSLPAGVAPAPSAEVLPRAPDDLALLLRVSDPQQLKREVASLLPSSAASMAKELEPKELVAHLIGEPLTDVVDLTQGIDFASVGAGDSATVLSLAVKPESEGTTEGVGERDENGLAHVGKREDRRGGGERGGRLGACAFTSSSGRASMRLVCASDESALARTAPYLARTVASEAFDADAKLELPGRVLRDRSDHTAREMSDLASAQLGGHLVEELLGEVDRIDGGLRFAGPRIELTLDFRFNARAAMLTKVFVPKSVAMVPPRAFYRLPGDSIVALFTAGALPEDMAPLRRALADNLQGTLLQDGYTSDHVRLLRERLETLLLTGGPLVFGAGIAGGRDGAERALAALDASRAKPADQARAEAQARSALHSWFMFELEEAPDRWTQGLRDVVRRAEEAEKARAAGSRSSTPRDPDGDHVDVHLAGIDASLKLPKDTLHLEVAIVPRRKGSRPARKGHLFVVPKGATTWLGYSEDVAAIAARLRLAIDDATEAGTLARSNEAAALRTKPVLGAGIVSLAGLVFLAAGTKTSDDLRSAARTASQIAGLGVKGTDVISWSAAADTTPGSVHLSLSARSPRQTAVDVVRLLGL